MRGLIWFCFVLLLGGCANTQNKNDVDAMGQAGNPHAKLNSNSSIYSNLAIAYMRENRMDIALQEGKKAVAAGPNDANAHNVLALIYQRLGQDGPAETHYKKAVSLDSRNFYALNAYGSFLCTRKRVDEAIKNFEAAVTNPLNRQPEFAFTNAGICAYTNGDKQRANDYLRKALSANANYPPALAQMAEIQYEMGDTGMAKNYLSRFERVGRHNASTLWTAYRIESRLKQKKTASRYRDLLRKQYPESKQVSLLRQMEKGA